MTFELRLTQKSLLIAIFCNLLFVSCKKLSDKEEEIKVEAINPLILENFFKPGATVNEEIIKIADNWSKQAGFKNQLQAFVAKNGFPLWDKAVYKFAGEASTKSSARVGSEGNSGISFIPLQDAQSAEIKSYVVCNKHSDSVYSYRLYNRSELLHNIANGNDSLRHASNLTLSLFAHFEKQINGNEGITINDSSAQKTISVSDFTINVSQGNVAGRTSSYYCGNIYTIRWVTMETVNGQTVFQAHQIEVAVFCEDLISGWDPSQVGSPASPTNGGSGGIYYYASGSLGGGGTSGTGWWNYANGYNGVYLEGTWFSYDNLYPFWTNYPVSTPLSEEDLILQNLITTLGLDQTQFNTLKANLNFVPALQHYLANSPEEPIRKIEKIKEHIDLMIFDNNYLSFCQTYTLSAYSLSVWWENEQWLNSNYPGLYSNIQQLKLDVKQSYYLLNNPELNNEVNRYLLNHSFSEDSKYIILAKLNPEQYPGISFDNITTPSNAADDPIIDNGISVEDIPQTPPPQAGRRIGKTENRNNIEDMQFGANGDVSGILATEVGKDNNALFSGMSNLFYWCTIRDNQLATVGNAMIERFRTNTTTSTVFENPVLNQKVEYSAAFVNFLKLFGNTLRDRLIGKQGNINDVSEIDMGKARPIFNGFFNMTNGLQILINDTEYTEIELDEFHLDINGKWTADVTVTIYDHFGLDKLDALVYQNKHYGFADWWLLQHTRSFVPYTTKITIRKRISGHL